MHSLKKNKEFSYIYKKGERVSTDNFTLFVVKSKFFDYRIGFSISKKLGKANKRNLLKRRLKEICRKELKISPYHNYVLLARNEAIGLDYSSLCDEIRKIFSKYEKKKSV